MHMGDSKLQKLVLGYVVAIYVAKYILYYYVAVSA